MAAKIKFEYPTVVEIETRCKVFVDAYLSNGFDAERAAISAGYDKHNADRIARYLLTKPDVMRELRKRTKRIAEKYTITMDMLLEEAEDAYAMATEQRNPLAMLAATRMKANLAGVTLQDDTKKLEVSFGPKEVDVLERIASIKKGSIDAMLQ